MVDRTMEVSTQGLKFSLRTFLSDSAPGLLVVTLLMVGPFYGQLLSLSKDHHQEILIAILIAMLLLAIPLGLTIDALGWFIFGSTMQRLEMFWSGRDKKWWWFFIESTKCEFDFEHCIKLFDIPKENGEKWVEISWRLIGIIDIYYPERKLWYDDIECAKIFLRSTGIILICSALFFPEAIVIMLVVGGIFFIASSWIMFYEALQVVFDCRILCLDLLENESRPTERIYQHLIMNARAGQPRDRGAPQNCATTRRGTTLHHQTG